MDGRRYVITIDGPNAVGKSEIAQALAERLGYTYVNTGAIYRAVAHVAMETEVGLDDEEGLLRLIHELEVELHSESGRTRIIVNGTERTRELYTAGVLSRTAAIAQIARVRAALLPVQRQLAAPGGVVMEGRDIGTTVLPNADWKFYLSCEDWRRAQRARELLGADERELYPDAEAIIEHLEEVDHADRTRSVAQLRPADDAIFFDTTYGPTASHDAHILWYYIKRKDELLGNCVVLQGAS